MSDSFNIPAGSSSGLADPWDGTDAALYVDTSAAAYEAITAYLQSSLGACPGISAAGGTVEHWIYAPGAGAGFIEVQNLVGGFAYHWQFDPSTGSAGLRVNGVAGSSIASEELACAPGWWKITNTFIGTGSAQAYQSRILMCASVSYLGVTSVTALGSIRVYRKFRVL